MYESSSDGDALISTHVPLILVPWSGTQRVVGDVSRNLSMHEYLFSMDLYRKVLL
jgi:hypothetical protein